MTGEFLREQGFRRSPSDFHCLVAEEHRSVGIGKLLMKAVAQQAEQTGCGMIKWYVAKWNQPGIEFYERLGAKIDPDWHEFQMTESAFRDLAAS